MAEINFAAKFHDMTVNLNKEDIPIEEMTSLATNLGVMTCIWEDPEGRPDMPTGNFGKVTMTIAIPTWDDPSKCQAWEEEMLKGEYSVDPKGKLKELWDKTCHGFAREFLAHEDVQGVRCSQCQEWHHREHEHVCPDVSEEQSE